MVSNTSTPRAASSPESEGEYFRKKNWKHQDVKRRHGLHGYDPLDRAFQQIREEKKQRSTFFSSPKSPSAKEHAKRATDLLKEHVETMKSLDLAFRYTFRGAKLGFSIVVARYGEEGREHVQIEATQPHCDLYTPQRPLKELENMRDKIMPTDELIAINGEYIPDVSAKTFPQILKKIQKAGRPLTATFVLGERREEAHSEQEEGRAMLREDLRLPDVSGYVKEAQSHRAIAADGLRQTRKAVRRLCGNQPVHAIEQASRRWCGGRRAVNFDFHTGRRQTADQRVPNVRQQCRAGRAQKRAAGPGLREIANRCEIREGRATHR